MTENTFSRRSFLQGGTITAAAALLALTGCAPSGGGGASGLSSETIEFWSQLAGSKKQAGLDLESAFASSGASAKIQTNLYGSPDQLNQKLLTGFVGGILPGLFIQHWDYSLTYASGGKLRPMGQALSSAGVDPRFAAYSTFGGKAVTAPLYGTTRALTINADIVADGGLDPEQPPQSWDEIREWARTLVRWKNGNLAVAGLHLYANDLELFEAFTLFLQGAGGRLLNDDNTDIAFDSDAGIAAAKFLRQLVVEDKVTVPGFGIGDSAAAPFYSNRAAFAINGNYSIGAAEGAEMNLVVAKVPGRDRGYTSLIDPFCFGIPLNSRSADAAQAFVEFALRPEQQIAFATTSRNIPVVPAALKSAEIAADPNLAAFADAANYAPATAPATPAFSRMYLTVARSLQSMFFGGTTAEEAIRSAAQTVRPFVREGARA